MYERAMEFMSQHIVLANINHVAGGFGLALVLQKYLKGNPFLPSLVGWLLIAFFLIVHIYAFTR